jgi:hypothetical protein
MSALHSRYNPHREAERYLSALSLPPQTCCFILIEPGQGYMIPILAERFPAARIIALHAEAAAGGNTPPPDQNLSKAAQWYPGGPLSAEEFLDRELNNFVFGNVESIKIIEWQPSREFYGERYVALLAAAAAAIRRFDAERRTLKAFGRRWFRNFFKNLRLLRCFPLYRPLSLPVIVIGAGPSLEESLPLIGELIKQQSCFIIASSSSVMALRRRNIAPDLVLSTDGGGWALLHLYELFRWTSGGRISPAMGIAASFFASLPSQCADLPLLGISDGSQWQTTILRGLDIPHTILPQRGTVTATALDLAFAISRGKVCLAGMDLDTKDIRTHARPYSFDRLWQEKASRINGEYGQHFFRQNSIAGGGSHKVYAEWFSAQLAGYPNRLCTLGDNNPLFAGLPQMDMAANTTAAATAAAALTTPPVPVPVFTPVPVSVPGGNLVSRALDMLKAGLEDKKTAEAIAGELRPLLFSDGITVTTEELWGEIRTLTASYTEESRGIF